MTQPAPAVTHHWSDLVADAEAIADALDKRGMVPLPAAVVAAACQVIAATVTLGMGGHRVKPEDAELLWQQAHATARELFGAIVLHGGLGE